MHEVAEFVHDNVVDAVNRCLNELEVQGDPPGGRATAPSRTHAAYFELNGRNAVPLADLLAMGRVVCEEVFCPSRIPLFDGSPSLAGSCLVGDGDLEESALQFGGGWLALFNMKAVLTPQEHERLAADVVAWRGEWVELLQPVE